MRYLAFSILCISFIIHHTLAKFILWDQSVKLKYFLKSISWTSWFTLQILGVRVSRRNHPNVEYPVKQKLIVCNHLSYLDALVLFAHYPSLFVTSVEIRETFLLGKLAELGGCFFVERRRSFRSNETIAEEMKMMSDKLNAGHSVFLFPEGTSSDGAAVLPFKSTFFQLALDSGVVVQPLCLRYSGEDSSSVPWFGEMTFPDHLFGVCSAKDIQAEIFELSPLLPGDFADRFELSRHCQELIHEAYAKN